MKTNFCFWKLLASGWLLLLLNFIPFIYGLGLKSSEHGSQESDEMSTFPAVTFPTLEPPPEEVEEQTQGTTPSDLDLNFDIVTEDLGDLETFETTTSITSSTSIVKTGRHFGSRIQLSSKAKSVIAESNTNLIQPALKPRPTSPVISFNPTNYNRILKRRKNERNGLGSSLFRSRSTQEVVSTETTEQPPLTTTPTPPSQIPLLQRRKLLFGIRTSRPLINVTNDEIPTTNGPSAETEFPTTLYPRKKKIKIMPIQIPALPRKPAPVSIFTTAQDTNATQEMVASHSWPQVHSQVPPPPKFDSKDDPSFTLDSDGVFRFKYSASASFPPTSSSSRIHSEEFALSRNSYGGDDDNDEAVILNEEEKTTFRLPLTVESETTMSSIVEIEASENEETTTPIHQDFFSDKEVEPLKEPPLISSEEITQVTVTVTVTENRNTSEMYGEEKINSKENIKNQNSIKILIISTPPLPDTSAALSSKSSLHEGNVNSNIVGHIFPTQVNTNISDDIPHTENQFKVVEIEDALILSPKPILEKEKLVLTFSNEFKSVFYSTNQEHPNFSTSSYYFSSSTQFSYFVPEDEHHHHHHHFHGQGNHHEHQIDEVHQHHHQPIGGEENMQDKEHQIQPSSSSSFSYWDTLGLKTPIFNQSELSSSSPTHSTILIGRDTTMSEEHESLKPRPREPTPSPIEEPKKPTPASPPSTQAPTHPPTFENEENKISEEDEKEEIKHEIVERLPPVAAFIQILLDMAPIQFCPSIKSFKEMIILVYKKNNKQVGLHQVILNSQPNCLSNLPAEIKSSNWKSQNSSPATNNAHLTTIDDKESDASGSERTNKTRRAHIGEPGDNLESRTAPSYLFVYVYLNDKNGTYDQILTESFVNLWNLTKAQEGLFFNKIRKVEMIISSEGVMGQSPSNENSGVIAAITVSSIAVICLILLGVLLLVMRHRQSQTNFAKRCTPVTLDDYSLDNISVFNSFRRKQRNRTSKRSYTNAGFDDPNAPTRLLDVEGLTTAVTEVSGMYDEFSRIPNVNPTLDDIPNGAEAKNRYANVIPMPDTRVLLTFQDDLPNSDYINANFVQGTNGMSKAYIITQGPLEETIVDFWRMIWEQQIRVIFMLTDFSEAGIPKCGEYYPRSESIDCSQLHGDFQVTLEKKDIMEHCITSYLVVKDMGRSLRRDVVHLWYHSWPEKGIPENPKSTVDFLVKSRKYTKESCPILVHCSPGTGRSGALVACDVGLKELDLHRKVNIPQIVKQLRHDRAGAVQTKEQYRHIYDVIQHYAAKCLSGTSKDT